MTYESMRMWVKAHDLIMNRVKVINAITGDACSVRCRRGVYTMCLWGRETAKWRAYDMHSVNQTLEVATALYRALWDVRRLGPAAFECPAVPWGELREAQEGACPLPSQNLAPLGA